MAVSDEAVALVGEGGQVIGSKLPRDITPGDMYHAVFIVLVTPQHQVIVSHLRSGRLSATAMTLCRQSETADVAAMRALPTITSAAITLHHLGDGAVMSERHHYYMSAFYGVAPLGVTHKNCDALNASDLTERFDTCTPAMQTIWQRYKDMLPV